MIRKILPGKLEKIVPDILIPYTIDRKTLSNSSQLIIYVRPETNKIDYEAQIIRAAAHQADVIYLANLNGALINNKAIIASHYSIQLQFAVEGKRKLEKYPEMVKRFEEKFKVNFHDAPIIGSHEAIKLKLKKDADELFETIVPEPDFLELYGQTIKRIAGYYVLNYDIPAIMSRYHEWTAMFVIAFLLKDNNYPFSEIDRAIYENMRQSKTTNLLDSESRKGLPWYQLVRRAYHISRSQIEAMFDLTDYVFKNETDRIGFADTPLGRKILEQGVMGEEELETRLTQLKGNPLVYLNQPGGRLKLVNIISEGRIKKNSIFIENDLNECSRVIQEINWEKSRSI
ncbi:MAG TPA: hypothetical protein VK186_14035 [Candidatus Deferrimicrobium sp.]|nr:hypothetical protein [Candidatus Deferrimicrobium sp.]